MANSPADTPAASGAPRRRDWARTFPWWLVLIGAVIVWMIIKVLVDPLYTTIFDTLWSNLGLTLRITLIAFVCSLVLGLTLGLGRIARNLVFSTIATTYIEFIRGVPILVLIFAISYAVVPIVSDLIGFDNTSISFEARAIIALVLIYSAYVAEIFRAGIESVGRGQMEAARSLGMSHVQAMRYIILPQAIRNVLPALGNDLIALLKDTSLVSVLGVRDITQTARLYVSSSFRYEETYFTLTLFYLTMTLVLSLILQALQRRVKIHG